jgi:hypothetical protein
LGDLYRELAFASPMAVVDLPGHVLAASVANTRGLPKPAPEFLHLDDGCRVEVRPRAPGAPVASLKRRSTIAAASA